MSAYAGTTDNWVKSYPSFNLKAYLDMMDDLVIRPYSKSTMAWTNMIHEKLIDAWNGNKSTEEVCKDIEKEMNSMLADE